MAKANRWFGLFGLLMCGFWANVAWAQKVAIVWAACDTGQTLETATRLRGELLAQGLTFVSVEARPESGMHDQLLPVGASSAGVPARVLIDVSATEALLLVDVWLLEEQKEPSAVAALGELKTTPNAPEKLAIRGAEALHSRLAERDWWPKKSDVRTEVATTVRARRNIPFQEREAPTSPLRAPRAERLGLALGAVVLTGERLSPAFVPRLHFEWVGAARFWWTASVAGLGSQSTAFTERGALHLSRHYALVGGSYQAEVAFLRPFIGISAGAMLCSIQGQADAPLRSHDAIRVVGLGELSMGSHVNLSDSYYLTLAGHAHIAQPGVAIYVVDELAATAGSPTWAASLAIGARL